MFIKFLQYLYCQGINIFFDYQVNDFGFNTHVVGLPRIGKNYFNFAKLISSLLKDKKYRAKNEKGHEFIFMDYVLDGYVWNKDNVLMPFKMKGKYFMLLLIGKNCQSVLPGNILSSCQI